MTAFAEKTRFQEAAEEKADADARDWAEEFSRLSARERRQRREHRSEVEFWQGATLAAAGVALLVGLAIGVASGPDSEQKEDDA